MPHVAGKTSITISKTVHVKFRAFCAKRGLKLGIALDRALEFWNAAQSRAAK